MIIPLLPYITKSTIILIVLLGYYQLVLQKQTFYNTNRYYLLGVMIMSQIIPLVQIEIPFFIFSAPHEPTNKTLLTAVLSEINVNRIGAPSFHYWQWIYFTGVVILCINYLFAVLRLTRLVRANTSKKIFRLRFIFLEKENLTCSFFNLLFINRSKQNKKSLKRIFAHEKIHIQQFHSFDLLLVHLFCMINWFNPLAWKLKKAIVQNHEYIADHHVIQKYSKKDYFELLINQVFKSEFSFTNHFANSNLKKRIIMMTKQQTQKCKVWKYVPAILLCGILFIHFSCNEDSSTSNEEIISLANTKNDIFYSVEDMPQFPEGDIQKWLAKNTKYPATAQAKGISGKVIIQFVIEKNGSIGEVKLLRGVDDSLDQEALRVVNSMPKWKPGKQREEPVRVGFTVPINFKLNQE